MNCTIRYETLAALAAGDLPGTEAEELERHTSTCPRCRKRLAALQTVDASLAALAATPAPASAALTARRAAAEAMNRRQGDEILALEDVANFLRLSMAELGEIAHELPAFELAGQVRVRRTQLLTWIEKREHEYEREATTSQLTQAVSLRLEKGAA